MTVRLAIVNPVWAPDLDTPDALLARYRTLTGWARAVAEHGVEVRVIQRMPRPASREIGSVPYQFVADGGAPTPSAARVMAVAGAIAERPTDIVHVNGVVFPRWTRALRRHVSRSCRLVVQDHGGWHPERASSLTLWWIRRGLSVADAVLVSSPGQVESWRAWKALPGHVAACDVMESSADVQPLPREDARRESGVDGDPAVLCVSRMTRSKDPMSVLEGFTRFAARQPGATLTWVFHQGELEHDVRRAVQDHGALSERVRLVGSVPHDRMAAFYSAADIVVSASRAEGSGYAAIEAMACGAVPVLTDIPSFRALTDDGRVGALWTPGDGAACARALTRMAQRCGEDARASVRARFDDALSWRAVGRRAAGIYRSVCGR